jgi:hypothetical protein
MQGGFDHDAPEVAWALLELLDAVGAEAELEPLPATVVEVVEVVEVVLVVAREEVVPVLAVVADDVLALRADDVVPPAEVLPA